ncbi:centromere protein I-like isoform X2 [Dermacentor albipictus]|uniref:centromere protein I-like isoform X2 n=1 Tax=Dermacentor albipictus TaxID=60249 RepID=UPI0038FC4EC1
MSGHRAVDAVRFLVSGDGRLENLEEANQHLCMLRAFALDAGISAEDMLQLSMVVTSLSTESFTAKSLLLCMVPGTSIAKDVILKFSGALCRDSISSAVKRELLQWMAATYHLFDKSCNIVLLCRALLRLLDTSLSDEAVNLMLLLASKDTATPFTMSVVSKASHRKPSDKLQYLAHVLEKCHPVPESHKAVKDEELGVQRVGVNTSIKQLMEAFERRPLDLTTALLNPEILKAMASVGKHRQIDYFQGHLRIALNDVFHSPETDKGRDFLKSLARMVGILQENPPAVEQWLMKWVGMWNVDRYWEQILALISSFSLTSPKHFFLCIWEPLVQVLFYQSFEMQVNIFQCFTELCRFWALVEVPRSLGKRNSVFVKTYEKETMNALERLITGIGHVGMALVQLHPNRLIEILLPVFEFYYMQSCPYKPSWTFLIAAAGWVLLVPCRIVHNWGHYVCHVLRVGDRAWRLEVFREARVIMLCLPEWAFVMLPVFSRNPLLIDGVCKMYLSLMDFLEEAKEHLSWPWFKPKIREYNNQVVWLGLALSGDWKAACAVGPQFSPSTLEAMGPFLSDSDSPFALWWLPGLRESVSELCYTHMIEPNEIVRLMASGGASYGNDCCLPSAATSDECTRSPERAFI